jgi:aminoglycoside 6'-N-acetyltransferase
VVRRATAADFDALVDLELESARHHAAIDPERWRVPERDAVVEFVRRRHAADPDRETLVAVADGEVVGAVEMGIGGERDPGGAIRSMRAADIGIVVASAWRSQGVGGALMRAAEARALEHGATRVVLDMSAANAGARRFYERLGYQVHGLLLDRVIDGESSAGAPLLSPWPENDGNRRIENAGAGGAGNAADAGDAGGPGGARVAEARVDQHGDPIPSLLGEQVRLRPLVPADRDRLIEILADPTVVEWWDTRGPEVSADELVADDEVTAFAVEVDGEVAGSIQFAEEEDPDYRHAGIDIFLHSRFQGRGLGTDAVRTLARYLLEVRGHHRLTIDPSASNERAIHTYAKIGFRPVGVMRRYERGPDGTFHDGLLMDLLAGELR